KKAYREIAAQVTVPGFRKGKVPTAVIDQRVGRGAVLNEAVQDAIPTSIVAAVREHDVRTLGRPAVEITEFVDGQPLRFTAELDTGGDTRDELRDDLGTRLTRVKRVEQLYAARDKALAALVEATDVPAPEGVVGEEVEQRKQAMADELERVGASLEEYLSA